MHKLIHVPQATTRYVADVIGHIRAFTYITRESIEKDQSKYINLKNKLLNLEKWEFEAHNPEIKLISQIPVDHNEKAECPRINKFLKDVVAKSDVELLCEIAGYCLTTDCSHQKAFMLYGRGSNGKSVFLALLESLVGKANTASESLQKLEHDKYRTTKLYGKRVNICGDIPDSKMEKTEIFKKLTSGIDSIDGENKYQDSFVFKNTAKLVFSANSLPEAKSDRAYYRRWQLITFPNDFEGGTEDKSLIKKLQAPNELSGFLNLALDALKRLKQKGEFTNSKSIQETQREY
jgi:putative DNA primase/helicase